MIHQQIVVGPLQCNCAIVACEKTKQAAIIDPGEEGARIVNEVKKAGFDVKYILHTHAHFDHIAGTKAVREAINAPICLHKGDAEIYRNLPMQGKLFGFQFGNAPDVEKWIEDNERLKLGEYEIEILHTPGHSPGSVCLKVFNSAEEKLFSGDTLFQMSIGRSDLWGGSHEQLLQSVRDRIFTLDGDIAVHPGHGPSTRVGDEKKSNPFFN